EGANPPAADSGPDVLLLHPSMLVDEDDWTDAGSGADALEVVVPPPPPIGMPEPERPGDDPVAIDAADAGPGTEWPLAAIDQTALDNTGLTGAAGADAMPAQEAPEVESRPATEADGARQDEPASREGTALGVEEPAADAPEAAAGSAAENH